MRETELEVLEQYDINVKSTRKIRGAILCEAEQGVFVLKETQFSDKRIPALYELYQHLQEQGYENADAIIKNKEGSCISLSEDGTRFLLKKWFCGKECDNKRESEILEAVRNLASLHQIMRKPFEEKVCVEESKQEEFIRHNQELKKVRSFVRKRVTKSEFELAFLKCFDEMYEWADAASTRLSNSKYIDLLEQSRKEHWIVHGDYNYHNILLTSTGIATTNFEHFHGGIQMTDFYYFLRKIMEKNHWNLKLGLKMIEEYDKMQTMSETEKNYLAVCIMYPEKFWKVANTYYRSRKTWLSSKSLEKLELATKQAEEKEKFLKIVFSYQK